MIIIHQPSITTAYYMLWRRVWHYGKRKIDQRGDKIRELKRVMVEIETDRIDYPDCCPVSKPIANKFVEGLIIRDCAFRMSEEFDYCYGERVYNNGQYESVIDVLKHDKSSRRCVITIFNDTDIYKSRIEGMEVPCVTQLMFDIEDDKLNMTLMMRSNEVFKAFPSDAYGFRTLQKKMADEIGVDIGNYYHYINNAHIIEHSSEDEIKKILGVHNV